MSYKRIFIIAVCAALVLFTLVSCTGGERTPEVVILNLTFDGQKCTYDGPTDLKTGPIQLIFTNSSNGQATIYFVRHSEVTAFRI